jgi:hypothetical protein
MNEDSDKMLQLLLQRHGRLTTVETVDGTKYNILDVSYGVDIGDEFHHIITNTRTNSGLPVDFFKLSEIKYISDTDTGNLIFEYFNDSEIN